jgi:hypothetical protein
MTAFLAITTATPHFQRDDIVDRALPMRLRRRQTFEAESKLLHEFDENRDELMGLLVERMGGVVDMLADNPSAGPSELRIADFGDFAERIASTFGVEKPKEILARVQQAQEDFTVEGDVIFEAVGHWRQKQIGGSHRVPLQTFRIQLLEIARIYRLRQDHVLQDPRSFGYAISQREAILRSRYQLDVYTGHARERFISLGADPVTPLLPAGPEDTDVAPGEKGEEGDEIRIPPPDDPIYN